MSQSIGLSIGYSRKRLKRLKRPSLGLNAPIIPTGASPTSSFTNSCSQKITVGSSEKCSLLALKRAGFSLADVQSD